MHTRRIAFALALGAVVAFRAPAVAETFKVGVAETGFPPYSFPRGDATRGIFLEVLDRVGQKTGDKFEAVHAPTVRLKAMFEKGQIDIEPGISPVWREDQATISAYSAPFATMTDVVLHRAQTKAPDLDRRGARPVKVGTVRGYVYPRYDDAFAKGWLVREDADNEGQLMALLKAKRVDVVFIGMTPARYYMKLDPTYRFVVGEEIGAVPVMYRIRKDRAALLERMDPVLEAMRRSGELDEIATKHGK